METADIVIIGGGVLGGAVAFYLARQGPGRVIVLERDLIAHGNSSLAAGLLTRGRFKSHLIPMALETYRAVQEIEALTGESLGMHRTGCLYIAQSPIHQQEIRELVAVSSRAGLKAEWIDEAAAIRLLPWLEPPPEAEFALMPEDAYIDGYSLASGYVKAARKLGVEVRERTEAAAILRQGARVTGVRTASGDLAAALVIDAAGVWAGLLAHEIGLRLPMAPVRSHYWITAEHAAFAPGQPFAILPDARAYTRPESNRLLFGFRETRSAVVDPRQLPQNMHGHVFKSDPQGWESLLEGLPDFSRFCPLLEEIEVAAYIKGLSNYTPDGNFVLGAFPGLDGFLAATGCAGAGIAMSGGIGRLVAELARGETPFVEPSFHRADRFGPIDPFDPAFLKRCGDARAGKITG